MHFNTLAHVLFAFLMNETNDVSQQDIQYSLHIENYRTLQFKVWLSIAIHEHTDNNRYIER